jgi:hypothetical protein
MLNLQLQKIISECSSQPAGDKAVDLSDGVGETDIRVLGFSEL